MADLSHASKSAAPKTAAPESTPSAADHDIEGPVSTAALDNASLAAAGATAPNGAPAAPPMPPRQVLRLQRQAGNHEVARLLSRKYQNGTLQRSVAAPNGAHTVEASPAPAEQVRSPEAQVQTAPANQVHRQAAGGVVQRFDLGIGGAILNKVAGWAKEIPGYHLLTVILGKDPISGATVERNAMNIAHGILSIVPGGNKIFENLQQSGALERFFEWVTGEIATLGLTFGAIKDLFSKAWDALGPTDLLDPAGAWNKVKAIFGPPLERIKNFAIAAGKKVLEFILEGVLKLAGPFGDQITQMLKKGGEIFNKIVQDPLGFLGNLLKAVKAGFEGFMGNILEHLKNGLMGWLFGALAGAGLTLPKTFDLKGILSIVLQVLGLTYQNLRGKLVGVLGEKTVGYIEKAVTFVKTLVTEGLAGAWKMILEWVGNLKDMVIGMVQDWVITSIVKAAVTKLVTMFNPVGAIIQGIITIYNTVSFFIERAQQIAAVATSIFDSMGRIAAGDIAGAAAFVEQTMAKTVPVIISFLASLLGLGGIGNTIRGIIQKIQAPIQKAMDKAVGFIVSKAKGIIAKLKGGAETPEQKAKVDAGLKQIDLEEAKHAPNGKLSQDQADKVAASVKTANPIFTSIKVVDGGTHWNYDYAIARSIKEGSKPKAGEAVEDEQIKDAKNNPIGRAQAALDQIKKLAPELTDAATGEFNKLKGGVEGKDHPRKWPFVWGRLTCLERVAALVVQGDKEGGRKVLGIEERVETDEGEVGYIDIVEMVGDRVFNVEVKKWSHKYLVANIDSLATQVRKFLMATPDRHVRIELHKTKRGAVTWSAAEVKAQLVRAGLGRYADRIDVQLL
jgi:hypothetical protein